MRKLRTFVDYNTGVVVQGRQSKRKLKLILAKCATWDGKLRFKDIKEVKYCD